MLINLIVVLIKHLLPLASLIIYTWLIITSNQYASKNQQPNQLSIFVGSLLCSVVLIVFISQYNWLIHYLDYLKVLTFCTFVLLASYVCFLELKQQTPIITWLILLHMLVWSYGIDFYLYLNNLFASMSMNLLLIALLLGIGICLSISCLLYFTGLYFIQNNNKQLILFGFSLFNAAQTNHVFNQLTQFDWLNTGFPLWNTSLLLAENSEWGLIFTALLGYEATPSILHVISYLIVALLPFILANFSRVNIHKHSELSNEN